MLKIHLANILLICILGTLLLWPNITEPPNDPSINDAYTSVCMITSGDACASGVLLESGYILTASHVVDRNHDGKIDDTESTVMVKFSAAMDFESIARVVTHSVLTTLDVAVLKADKEVPLKGIKMISDEEYDHLRIGAPIYTIGMPNGSYPGNITDGRIIDTKSRWNEHRNSANSYMGNSGGGVFHDDKLIGISSAVGIGRMDLQVPIFEDRQFVGIVSVLYNVPLANVSTHVPIPAIREFLNKNCKDALIENPIRCPYRDYFGVTIFNLGLALFLLIIFKIMQRHMK